MGLARRLIAGTAAAAAMGGTPHPVAATTAEPHQQAADRPTYKGLSANAWAYRYRVQSRRLYRARLLLRRRWRPTVTYALTLASRAVGVSYWELRRVAYCESTLSPFAVNGRYRGLFQLSWTPFGLDPFDPVANALSAAMTVRHDGGWRQWECKP